MRISDWSSDVCSSDLGPLLLNGRERGVTVVDHTDLVAESFQKMAERVRRVAVVVDDQDPPAGVFVARHRQLWPRLRRITDRQMNDEFAAGTDLAAAVSVDRSEEHTSELQSLMRISYAVFCLKKKTTKLEDE